MPRVSVIIPAYNTAPFISQSLDSVLSQSFDDIELIVINDGSPDTPQLESVLGPYMDRIQYIKQENRGLPAARNTGIGRAAGEFLAFLDSDDIWFPDYLEIQVRFLEEHFGVVASITDAVLFGLEGGESVWKMVKTGAPAILTFDRMLKREGGQLPSATV
ncbi:MAG TPA: glycosyltransferase family A protein, partial [Blastocatellia bacterium]|nr:glycosyltransferase family A protein [Blastocatellia bacterium]